MFYFWSGSFELRKHKPREEEMAFVYQHPPVRLRDKMADEVAMRHSQTYM